MLELPADAGVMPSISLTVGKKKMKALSGIRSLPWSFSLYEKKPAKDFYLREYDDGYSEQYLLMIVFLSFRYWIPTRPLSIKKADVIL